MKTKPLPPRSSGCRTFLGKYIASVPLLPFKPQEPQRGQGSIASLETAVDITSCYMAFLFRVSPRESGLPEHPILPTVRWYIWNDPFLELSNEWHLQNVLVLLASNAIEISCTLHAARPGFLFIWPASWASHSAPFLHWLFRYRNAKSPG